jgi:hypothetical protein
MSHYGVGGTPENNAEMLSHPALAPCVVLKNGACHIPALGAPTPKCDHISASAVNAVSSHKSYPFTALRVQRALSTPGGVTFRRWRASNWDRVVGIGVSRFLGVKLVFVTSFPALVGTRAMADQGGEGL